MTQDVREIAVTVHVEPDRITDWLNARHADIDVLLDAIGGEGVFAFGPVQYRVHYVPDFHYYDIRMIDLTVED